MVAIVCKKSQLEWVKEAEEAGEDSTYTAKVDAITCTLAYNRYYLSTNVQKYICLYRSSG